MDWLLDVLAKGRQALAFFQDPIILDALGLFIVYAVVPVVAFVYAKRVRRARRKMNHPMSGFEFWGMLSMVAGLSALFVGQQLCGWPVDRALKHAIFMTFLLPVSLPWMLDQVEKRAPDLAEDIGDMPTEFRAADTTEMATLPNCLGDQKDKP